MLDQSTTLDRVFAALSDTSRRQMVERLGRGPASVSELAEPLAMSLAAVLQHVRILETSGLVRTEKIGRVRTCQLEPVALDAVDRWVASRRGDWERRLDRLGQLFEEDESPHPDRDNQPKGANHD